MTTAASKPSSNGPRYAPEDPTLPKPWRGLVDGSTGYLYYWNPVTNVTQYERPEPEQLPPPPPLPQLAAHPPKSVSSSVQIHQELPGGGGSGRREGHEDDGRHLGSRGHQHQGSRGSSSHSAYGSAGHDSSSAHGRGHAVLSSRESGQGRSSGGLGDGLSAEAYRRQHEITVNGGDIPAPHMTFESTGFPSEILREVHHAGFSTPTPIQAQSWPIALNGRDIVAIAKTGSGKTLGYLIPGFIHVKHLHNNPKMGPTMLVLSPTRELATQIQEEAVKFGRSSRITSGCLYGGAPKGPQLRDLDRGVDIVVATPGRLNDILEMRRVSLRQVSYLVLDEADRMLDMGFELQIRKIIKEIPPRRQTLMFTATWPKEVRKIAADLLVNPVQVNIGSIDELVANKAITQYVEVITPSEKLRRLEHILRSQEPGSKVLVFCSTKRMCDQLARTLTRQFGGAAIHGDKSQSERDWVLNQFRTGKSPILVATDVAARGLDIKDIRVVINYDFPTGVEDYVHRIGRTGRAGATGVAYTFFCSQDSKYASDLVKVLEGASQRVPSELRDMVARGGYGGKSIRWASGSSARDGGRLNGGLRSDSSYGARGGRGQPSTSGRTDSSYGGRGRSRSPAWDRYSRRQRDGRDTKATTASGGHRVGDRACSRSRSPSPSWSRGRGGWGNGRGHSGSRSPYRGHAAYGNGHGHVHGRSRSRSRSRSLKRGRSSSRSHSASRSSKRNNGPGPEHDHLAPLRRESSPLDHHNGGSVHSSHHYHQQPTSPFAVEGTQEARPDPGQSPQPERPLSPYKQTGKRSPSAGQTQWVSPYRNCDAEGALPNKPSTQPLLLHHHVEDEEEGMISADEEGMIPHEVDAGPKPPGMKDQEP